MINRRRLNDLPEWSGSSDGSGLRSQPNTCGELNASELTECKELSSDQML